MPHYEINNPHILIAIRYIFKTPMLPMKIELIEGILVALSKACNESWVQQLTGLYAWALTAWILLNKVLFSLVK